jgi:hypothetical protein
MMAISALRPRNEPRFTVGTEWLGRGKYPTLNRIEDILRTYNAAGELVGIDYLSSHDFMGQRVTQRDVDTTIAMGIDRLNKGFIAADYSCAPRPAWAPNKELIK